MLRAVAVRCCWLALLVLSTFASAQIQPATPNDSAKYSLTGTVVNSVTGEPIRRALVQIYTGAQLMVLTDGNGRFEYDNLSRGQTSINVRKPGFFTEEELHRAPWAQTLSTIGPDSHPVLLKLIPASVVYGHIQNASGEPVEHMPVKLITNQIVDGRKRWQQSGDANTNDDGEFRIANLRPGTYYLEVGPGSRSPLINSTGAYPFLFYPGVSDFSAATPLEVAPGQQVNADLSVRPVPVFKVSGSILGTTPDQGVNLQFRDQLGNDFSLEQRINGQTREFQAMAPAGSYTVIANGWSTAGQSVAEFPLNVTSDVAGIRLTLAPANAIPIHVRTEATHSATQPSGANRNIPSPNIHLVSDGHGLFSPEFGPTFVGDPKNQSFALSNVPPGKYSVEVNANPPWYVQSAQCGDADLLREELTIAAGTPPIELALRDDGATLTGQLKAGPNDHQAIIVVVPDHGSSVRTENVEFDSAGRFRFENIAPGNYSVYAFSGIDGLEYRNPEILERYSSKASRVTVQPNEEHKIDLVLITLQDGP